MCHRLCMADYEEVFRRIMEFEKSGPATEPLGVSQGTAEHLPGGTRPPRQALPRREVSARRSSPAASAANPRAARTGPRGAERGVEEGVRAQDASRRSGTVNTVPLFEMDRAKTSRRPIPVPRGSLDAPRMGTFDKHACGVERGLSRQPRPKARVQGRPCF